MMSQPAPSTGIHSLLDRLARIVAAEGWAHDLNPAQAAALSYLSRANRFSRSPSVVAEYLGATRGTVSQTLKALQRKGLISESANPADKRSISYTVTDAGQAMADRNHVLDHALQALPAAEQTAFRDQLEAILHAALAARDYKTFGICKTCRHHVAQDSGAYCALLDVPLQNHEVTQICVEQEPVPGHAGAA